MARAAAASRTPAASGARRTLKPAAREPAASLDRLIHERLRLAILSALATRDALTHNDLKALLRTTDGNLSVHARKLEEAGYVSADKRFEGRVPRTRYRLTERGRRAFERYLEHMEALIRAARGG
ncbi:MAG: winged helix-turn-helix domain-containing protein [Gaiellaceae bacterium]